MRQPETIFQHFKFCVCRVIDTIQRFVYDVRFYSAQVRAGKAC